MSSRLTDERFEMLSQDYEDEQAALTARVQQLDIYYNFIDLMP
ncbi:hypothetical protein [Lutispora sp.]|nr:hypothetical protein [Lutispora sp.]MEA4963806.1 hypothetical protein [Lutispora sp.]